MNEDTATIQSKAVERRDLIIVLTASVGLFLSTLDTGIINVALPSLERKFDVGISEMAWSITLYLLLLSATIVIFARISDRIGRLKVYFSGLVLFAVASLLCGFASSAVGLILFRGIQGIGAAMLQATAAPIITTQIPRNRQGTALGTLGMMLGLGPVLGPSVGGLLLSFVGWRWIFWINIPICVIGLIGTQRLMRIRERAEKHSFTQSGGEFPSGCVSVRDYLWAFGSWFARSYEDISILLGCSRIHHLFASGSKDKSAHRETATIS
ncbi:MFS transporter [Alicyclobacillus sp. ALC3]|uniref:MFS transporter n=1 Tax=Alicyclobacillus sp. ALC3 TaxID=2796143 RepID=UPI002378656A|nr:MFS transporter [Alicyclobacillus sp. ALC3]WDL96822.1 MFS transporter [Alicyclobacillus sp. ALC3]